MTAIFHAPEAIVTQPPAGPTRRIPPVLREYTTHNKDNNRYILYASFIILFLQGVFFF